MDIPSSLDKTVQSGKTSRTTPTLRVSYNLNVYVYLCMGVLVGSQMGLLYDVIERGKGFYKNGDIFQLFTKSRTIVL